MFNSIKTSKRNREVVTNLTYKLGLGPENIVARLALGYSLSKEGKLDINDIQDSQGKEYSRKVLFGDYEEIYWAMICTHYDLYKTDKDLPKYLKLHLDHGLQLIDEEYGELNNISGLEFVIQKVDMNNYDSK